ncbi:MAG TPA: hypothetical protein DCS93_33865 [Microscillaceae bacterium]|nr:hypothetical protein [Microscillaceae bacterium]
MQTFTTKYTKIYITALFLIAVFTIGSQLFLQLYLQQEEAKSHIINISGRQRMLSQKITKEAILILQAKNEVEFNKRQVKLTAALDLWNRSHQGLLKGDSSLNLPEPNMSLVNRENFKKIQPYKDRIAQAALKLTQDKFSVNKAQQEAKVGQILANEEHFLKLMNDITFRFDERSKENIVKFRILEIVLMSITLLLLGLEGFLIFRPTFRKIDESIIAINENKEEIEAQNHMLNQVLEKVKMQNDNLVASIKYAETIQNATLALDPSVASCLNSQFFIMFRPLQVVSGDFYYVADTEEELILAAVDCHGHGIPGALLSMIGVAILNDIIKAKKITNPGNILFNLDQTVRKTLHQESNNNQDGMDMALISIEKTSNEVRFAGAKNPLVYICDDQLHEIKGDRITIGGRSKKKQDFTTHHITISHSTMFYLFSDGYLDQFGGPDRRKFMSPRFRQLLLDNHEKGLQQQRQALETTFDTWMNTHNDIQVDDVLVMGVRLYPI